MASWFSASAVVGACALVELWSSAASACSCRPPSPPEAALADADAVFEGRTFASESVGDEQIRWQFEVTRQWKGELPGKVTIVSAANSAMCGRNYEPGTSYLIYAQREDDHLEDNLCSRTRAIASASEDLQVLGPGRQPAAHPSGAPQRPTDREPPRIESPPPGPPPAQPGRRGCTVDPAQFPPAAWWLVAAAVAFRRRRTVASPC